MENIALIISIDNTDNVLVYVYLVYTFSGENYHRVRPCRSATERAMLCRVLVVSDGDR